MDTAQWPQEIELVNNIEGSSTAPNTCTQPLLGERRAKPEKDQALNCPRCNSTNTKFCYYNNYSLTQPRYFCKTCRRYWTEGGTLRNVPVGGGSRKNKRSSSSSPSSAMITASSSKVHHDLNPPTTTLSHLIPPSQNPKISLEGQHTLEFSFPTTQNYLHGNVTQFVESLPKIENNKSNHVRSSSSPSSALELLRSTGIASRGLNNNSYITMPVMPDSYSSGFPIFHELKPTLSFSFEGMKSGNGNFQGIHQGNNGNGRLLFPFGEVKQLSSGTNEVDHQNKGQSNSTGYNNWNGMFGGGSW